MVPKEVEALDQSITMFNLVNVCVFCAQYFDPDFEGGIAAPERQPSKAPHVGILNAIKTPAVGELVNFIDSRFIEGTCMSPGGTIPPLTQSFSPIKKSRHAKTAPVNTQSMPNLRDRLVLCGFLLCVWSLMKCNKQLLAASLYSLVVYSLMYLMCVYVP